MGRILWIGIALMLGASAFAAEPSRPPASESADGAVYRDAYPAVEVRFAGEVRGLPGIPYWTPGGFRPLTLDLYLPSVQAPRPDEGFPLIVFIHGGAWMSGNSRGWGPLGNYSNVLASIASRGYVLASVNYRLSGEAKFPAQIQDVKAAIRFLRIHAGEYGINPKRVAVWGLSAGGHLAALAGVGCDIPEFAPGQTGPARYPGALTDKATDAAVSDCVQGAVAWYGVFDMAAFTGQAESDGAVSRDKANLPIWLLLGCFEADCSAEQIRLASPASFVGPHTPPMLLIAGDQDKTVPVSQSLNMAAKLKEAGVAHELVVLPGFGHNFIGKTPEETQKANLKALAATIAFVDRTIGYPGERIEQKEQEPARDQGISPEKPSGAAGSWGQWLKLRLMRLFGKESN